MPNPLLDTSSLPRFGEILPAHVVPAVSELIAAHRQKLDELLDSADDPDFSSLIAPLEAMEHELSRVWSPVSHLQAVLGSREWRDAYNEALPLLTEYATELSHNVRLQRAHTGNGAIREQPASGRSGKRVGGATGREWTCHCGGSRRHPTSEGTTDEHR